MNEKLRKKIPKEIMIGGVKGKLHRSATYFSEGSFKTYIEYKFETKELMDKLLGWKMLLRLRKEHLLNPDTPIEDFKKHVKELNGK